MSDAAGFFLNQTLKALHITFKKVVLPGRVKCGGTEGGNSGGSWLPEEKKANMWHGRGNSGG